MAAKKTWTTTFTGKSFCFAGEHWHEDVQKMVTTAGGKVTDRITAKLDYLVLLSSRGTRDQEKQALQLNNKQGATIQIIDPADLFRLLAPTRDEALAMLRGTAADLDQWRRLTNSGVPMPDLSGADFRKLKIGGWLSFGTAKLDGADFRGAKFEEVAFQAVQQVNFEGATFTGARSANMTDCNLRKATLVGVNVNPGQFTRCDFTSAKMRKFEGRWSTIADCIFHRADLSEAELEESKIADSDFSSANLKKASLQKCELTACKFVGANLADADLTDAKLQGADLTNADLRGACLLNADLSNAIIDGANFTGANIYGTNLQGLDPAKAKGLDPNQALPKGTVGPNMRELEKQAKQAKSFHVSVRLDLDKGHVNLGISASKWGISSYHTVCTENLTEGKPGPQGASIPDSMLYFANRYREGKFLHDSVAVKATKAAMGSRELKHLVLAAWCEALGLDVISEEDLRQQQKTQKADLKSQAEAWRKDLRGGAKNIKKWNALTLELREKLGKFRRADFSGVDLSGVDLYGADLEGACFDNSELGNARFGGTHLKGASFKNAKMKGGYMAGITATDANFEGARFVRSNLRNTNWRRASFQNADLSGTDFSFADVCGTDFSTAKLAKTSWQQVKFDEETRFPKGFVLSEAMLWKGKGRDPRLPEVKKPTGPFDLAAFMKEIEKNTDSAKRSKALSMLKADRFKLYAQVEKDHLVGVVKSQTDPELVYSCRLGSDGVYGCCTQNLNICGGLRRSLCKHLLVLIMGLAKNNELDLAEVVTWAAASRAQKPALDKDAMSATFLKYKGAEAGEIDWRPTETIPEDYYAF